MLSILHPGPENGNGECNIMILKFVQIEIVRFIYLMNLIFTAAQNFPYLFKKGKSFLRHNKKIKIDRSLLFVFIRRTGKTRQGKR